MIEKATRSETTRFGSIVEETLQNTLRTLGGREIGSVESDDSDDILHDNELYGVSIKGRWFVFRDPAAFHRFKEEMRV